MTDILAVSFAIVSTLLASAGLVFFKQISTLETREMLKNARFIMGGILFVL